MSEFQDVDLLTKFNRLREQVKQYNEKEPRRRQPNYSKGVTAYDPMSPYEYIPPKQVFTDLAEVINEKSFHGSYPQSYTPVPEYFKKYGYSPYYDPEEFTDYARGALTIANMIELTANDQPWKLDRIQDLYLIKEIVDRYYSQMNLPSVANDIRVKAYKQRVEMFLRRLNKAIAIHEHRTGRSVEKESIIHRILKLLGGQ